jgi:hypothetical protein
MTGAEEGAIAQSAGSLVCEAEKRSVPVHVLMERGDVVKILDDLTHTHHIDAVMTARTWARTDQWGRGSEWACS